MIICYVTSCDTRTIYVRTMSVGGLYDSGSPILITSSLAFPHIDLVKLHVHMLLCVLRRQLFLSLSKTLHRRSRFAIRFPI